MGNTRIRVGIGGWTYAPWRGNFYPAGLAQKRELEYASRQLSCIEINATYHGTMAAASFRAWRDATPDDFVFAVKASRFATNRRILADADESISRFIDSGITGLGPKLGPLLWQFMPTKQFDAEDFEAFLALLPERADGIGLRHVLEVRHASFLTPDFLRLARKYHCATVFTDSDQFPSFADTTADFVYARLMAARPRPKTGYTGPALDRWATTAQAWASGDEPADLPRIAPLDAARRARRAKPRDVFVLFINGAKERAPAAAQALLARLGPGAGGTAAPRPRRRRAVG